MSGHRIIVEAVEDITPLMRRVHFGGPGVAGYAAAGPHLPNIKLFFPAPGLSLDLPDRGEHGYVWRPGQRERVRTYTVRSLSDGSGADGRPGPQRLAVDFVRHGDDGLASSWAERAVPGDELGALAGGGAVVGEADWVLLLGDETALPAIGGLLERFGSGQRGLAVIEVAGPAEEQDLDVPPGVVLRWLHRGGRAPGTTTLLQDALAGVEFPAAELAAGQVRIWVSAESAVVRFARAHLKARGFARREQLIIGYWHRGMNEPGYAKGTDHDRVPGELDAVFPGQAEPHHHGQPAPRDR